MSSSFGTTDVEKIKLHSDFQRIVTGKKAEMSEV